MRDVTLRVAIALALVGTVPAARAQHWNDAGPGRDLLSSTTAEFDAFRQRAAAPPAPGATPGVAGQPQARAPIPILDWVAPPAAQPAPPQRRPTPRRATTPREPSSLPAAAPRGTGGDPERTLADRERELERLRRILEEDRLRFERSRQPQLQ